MQSPLPRRAWPRVPYSIRVILAIAVIFVIADAAIPLSLWIRHRSEQRAIESIIERGGKIRVDAGGPKWLRDRIDDDHTEVFDRATRVQLTGPTVADGDAVELGTLTELTELNLNLTRISDDTLARLDGLQSLTELYLSQTPVGDAGVAHLSGLINLRCLDLTGTRVSDTGLRHLRGLKNLAILSLGRTRVTSAGLAELSGLTAIVRLDLAGTQVGNEGLAHLTSLPNLEILDLEGTITSDAGVRSLVEMKDHLRILNICKTQITDDGIVEIVQGLPRLQLRY